MSPEELLTTTRAVRRRLDLDRPVPRTILRDCIRIATQAPSGRNVQRWRWVVIDDPARKRDLAELWRRSYGDPRAGSTEAEPLRRIMASSDHLATILDRVPSWSFPACSGGRRWTTALRLADFYGSGLPAVWSFMLAARLHGLGHDADHATSRV